MDAVGRISQILDSYKNEKRPHSQTRITIIKNVLVKIITSDVLILARFIAKVNNNAILESIV